MLLEFSSCIYIESKRRLKVHNICWNSYKERPFAIVSFIQHFNTFKHFNSCPKSKISQKPKSYQQLSPQENFKDVSFNFSWIWSNFLKIDHIWKPFSTWFWIKLMRNRLKLTQPPKLTTILWYISVCIMRFNYLDHCQDRRLR